MAGSKKIDKLDPIEELDGLCDLSPKEVSDKLGISVEAAEHVLDAIADYLEGGPGEEIDGDGNGETEEL